MRADALSSKDARAVTVTLAQRAQWEEAARVREAEAVESKPNHSHRRAGLMPRVIADAVQFKLTGVRPQNQEAARKVRAAARRAVAKYAQRETAKQQAIESQRARRERIVSGAQRAVDDIMADIAISRRRHVHRSAFAVKDRPPLMKGDY